PVPVCEVVNRRFPAGVLRMSVGRETGDHPMRNEFVGSTPRLSAGRPSRKERSTSDEALIERIASGNRLAMQALFIRHQARIYRFILRLVRETALAEDLTSDVFLTVWQQAHRFEARSSAAIWLLASARHTT